MRVLVAIAYYGTSNEPYMRRVLDEYASMSMDVHVVVLTEELKDLPAVEQRVGLPITDPYSLPFAHKDLFVERQDDYDLFIYSEDDTLMRERDIRSFLWASEVLPDRYIAGFLRTEETADGTFRCSSVHNNFRWDPDSAFEAGGEVFAHFTNPHGAAFILTQSQLRAAIASGGFLQPPRKGRFSMRVTAATDPYTSCEWEKVICVSRLDDFLLPHLSNRYLNTLGLPLDEFRRQADAVCGTVHGEVGTGELFAPITPLDDHRWDKRFYEEPSRRAIDALSPGVRSVLSLGVGSGAAEAALAEAGYEVVGVPIDEIIAVTARNTGIELTAPDIDGAIEALAGRRFDALVAFNALQYFEDPVSVLSKFATLLAPDATVVTTVPNRRRYRLRARLRDNVVPVPSGSFAELGVHIVGSGTVRSWLHRAGFGKVRVFYDESKQARMPASLGADQIVVTARLAPAHERVAKTTSDAPRVSIGLPVYNGEDYLEACLQSIADQDYHDFELIICDNASTDATETICRAAAERDDRISYHRQEQNLGAAYNYNDCFLRSRGEFFAWIAHDDLRAPRFISRCLAAFDEKPESVVLVYPKAEFIDAAANPLRPDRFGVDTREAAPHRRLRRVVGYGGAVNPLFGLIRGSALARTRLIGPFVASDRVLLAELALLGELHEIPDVLTFRRLHERTSTEANPDAADLTQWFDTSARGPGLGRSQRLLIEYSRSALRLPLSASDRLACLATIPSTMGYRMTRNSLGRFRSDLARRLDSARPG
jgi:SAM-dependent methyltransferase